MPWKETRRRDEKISSVTVCLGEELPMVSEVKSPIGGLSRERSH